MKISFYHKALGWHGNSELPSQTKSVCIEYGGKKVYVFENKDKHTVGVNIFDMSKHEQKILSFNELDLNAGDDEE